MITVKNLEYSYPGTSTMAVRDVSFEIEKGEIFGLLGPSGAGKTTTQKILNGLLKAYQGEVTVLGKAVQAWGSDLYEQVGVSFELPNHFQKLTGKENLAYFGALYKAKTTAPEALLATLDLADAADVPVSQYSKGMKNRLSVARALLHSPALLFLDEPTAGLDPVNIQNVVEIIRAHRAQGGTVFITTHDMTLATALCDRVAFMIEGEISLIDSPRALQLRYGKAQVWVEYALDEGEGLGRDTYPLHQLGQNPHFLHQLQSGRIQTLHTQEATLADIFIEVTGSKLA